MENDNTAVADNGLAELEALSAVCRRHQIPLYLDGARLGYALASDGADFTLADIAFGAASNCEEETGTVTLSTSIQFLAPGRKGPFTAEARLVRGGRRIVTYDVDVRDADGTLLVHAVTQGMKTDRPFKVVK